MPFNVQFVGGPDDGRTMSVDSLALPPFQYVVSSSPKTVHETPRRDAVYKPVRCRIVETGEIVLRYEFSHYRERFD